VAEWTPDIKKNTIPVPGPYARARMNFWFMPGFADLAQSIELTVSQFSFQPITKQPVKQ